VSRLTGHVQLFDDTTNCQKNQRKPLRTTQLFLEYNLKTRKVKKFQVPQPARDVKTTSLERCYDVKKKPLKQIIAKYFYWSVNTLYKNVQDKNGQKLRMS